MAIAGHYVLAIHFSAGEFTEIQRFVQSGKSPGSFRPACMAKWVTASIAIWAGLPEKKNTNSNEIDLGAV